MVWKQWQALKGMHTYLLRQKKELVTISSRDHVICFCEKRLSFSAKSCITRLGKYFSFKALNKEVQISSLNTGSHWDLPAGATIPTSDWSTSRWANFLPPQTKVSRMCKLECMCMLKLPLLKHIHMKTLELDSLQKANCLKSHIYYFINVTLMLISIRFPGIYLSNHIYVCVCVITSSKP